MCGRYTSRTPPADLAAYFGVDEVVAPDHGPRYNVAPTDEVYAVAATKDATTRLGTFRWGLVPFWAKDLSVGARMINARAETVLEKAAFRRPLERRRCIIPADGFYEWQSLPGGGKGAKQPWYIRRRDGDVLAFAGLWESWRPGNRSERGSDEGRVVSCTIITTDANDAVRPIHDRMPVALPPAVWAGWLDPSNDDVDTLHRLLVPAPSELFELVPVSTAVNDVRNDGAHLIEPVDPPPSGELFPVAP